MARATNGKQHHKKKAKILKDAKGYIGARSKLYRTAKDARRRALQNEYKDRRRRKRDMRQLWIVRIGAAARLCGISYSKLMSGLHEAKSEINRKMLADLAVRDFDSFKKIVETIKGTAA
ncbi:MAG: 50S ribosomal protein L20 [Spirochaetes bacterium]|nr:50S ribosomal protein L20 [Spirochaetota bacterium]